MIHGNCVLMPLLSCAKAPRVHVVKTFFESNSFSSAIIMGIVSDAMKLLVSASRSKLPQIYVFGQTATISTDKMWIDEREKEMLLPLLLRTEPELISRVLSRKNFIKTAFFSSFVNYINFILLLYFPLPAKAKIFIVTRLHSFVFAQTVETNEEKC